MKRLKRVAALVLAAVVVFVSGQMLGTTTAEAAGGMDVTILNAQVASTPTGVLSGIGMEADEFNHLVGTYIVNDATYIKLSYATIGGGNAILPYTVNAGIQDGGYSMVQGGGHYRFSSIKEKAGSYADGYILYYGSDTDYSLMVLIPQSKAAANGLTAVGTKTDDSTCEMYRMYNPNSGEHFYTANAGERDNLKNLGWNYEGVGWTAPAYSGAPVYRLYNPNAGDHHYTTNAGERDNLVRVGWKDEGIGWYSDEVKVTPLYRMYNPNCTGAGAHHYTTNYAEAKNLNNIGWNYEGFAWYGL